MLVSSPRPKCSVTGFPDMVGNVCYKVLQCPDALRRAKTRNMLKYRKVTTPGIEPRTFWTYTRCSNQLSYLALEFTQLILYLCNCQPKDTYSARHIQCHSLHARSTLWPWHDQISQFGNHVTDYIIQFQQQMHKWAPHRISCKLSKQHQDY